MILKFGAKATWAIADFPVLLSSFQGGSRRLWFTYEWLSGEALQELDDLHGPEALLPVVDVLDENRYSVISLQHMGGGEIGSPPTHPKHVFSGALPGRWNLGQEVSVVLLVPKSHLPAKFHFSPSTELWDRTQPSTQP